jgi:group I intron endonuclease
MALDTLSQGGVYRILNLTNGRLYVGSTKHFKKRWKAHRDCLKAGRHHSISLQRAWLKYGPIAFSFEVLETVKDFAQLLEREQFWMDDLRVADGKVGYNISPTAGNCLGVVHGAAVRAKISARFKGKPKTPEHRAKIGAAHRALAKHYLLFGGKKPSPRIGTTLTLEVRAKMRDAAVHRWSTSSISEETRKKISEASRAQVTSEAKREKCRLINLGRKISPETGKKIAEANRARNATDVLFRVTRERGLSSPNQKIPPEAFAAIIMAHRSGEKMSTLAARYGVNQSSISRLISGSTHKGRSDLFVQDAGLSNLPLFPQI